MPVGWRHLIIDSIIIWSRLIGHIIAIIGRAEVVGGERPIRGASVCLRQPRRPGSLIVWRKSLPMFRRRSHREEVLTTARKQTIAEGQITPSRWGCCLRARFRRGNHLNFHSLLVGACKSSRESRLRPRPGLANWPDCFLEPNCVSATPRNRHSSPASQRKESSFFNYLRCKSLSPPCSRYRSHSVLLCSDKLKSSSTRYLGKGSNSPELATVWGAGQSNNVPYSNIINPTENSEYYCQSTRLTGDESFIFGRAN